jgi:hypothetical protein
MNGLIFGPLVFLALPAATVDRGPVPDREDGLAPGDRFTVAIRYSNRWSDEMVSSGAKNLRRVPRARAATAPPQVPSGERSGGSAGGPIAGSSGRSGKRSSDGGPGSRQANRVPPPRPRTVSLGRDPLSVALTFHGEATGFRTFRLRLDVSGVHYWNDRGDQWTIDLREADAVSRARSLTEELRVRWAGITAPGIEKDLVEEQLLGVSLVLLHGLEIEAAIDSPSVDARIPGFYEALESRLAGASPRDFWPVIMAFLVEMVARITPPTYDPPAQGATFEARGIPYKVERIARERGRRMAKFFGKSYQLRPGIGQKDWITVDLGRGLVVERRFERYQETRRGATVRFGRAIWEASLTGIEEASRKEAAARADG